MDSWRRPDVRYDRPHEDGGDLRVEIPASEKGPPEWIHVVHDKGSAGKTVIRIHVDDYEMFFHAGLRCGQLIAGYPDKHAQIKKVMR